MLAFYSRMNDVELEINNNIHPCVRMLRTGARLVRNKTTINDPT